MKTLLLAATLAFATGAVAAPATYLQQLELVQKQLSSRDYVAAQQSSEALLEVAQTPDEKVEALTLVGLTLSHQKLYARAIGKWQDALTYQGVTPTNRQVARRLLADTYRETEQWDNAIREYEKMLADPGQSASNRNNTLNDLASVYVEKKDFVRGREIYRRIVQAPNMDETSIDSAYQKIAATYQSESNQEQERLLYLEMLQRPNLSSYGVMFGYRGLGDLYQKEGDSTEAAKQYQQAHAILLERAKAQKEAKHWPEVVDALFPLVFSKLPPLELVDLYQQMGDAFVQMGSQGEARQKFERGIEIANESSTAPNNRDFEAARQRLQLSIAQTYLDEKDYPQARAELLKTLALPGLDENIRNAATEKLRNLPQVN